MNPYLSLVIGAVIGLVIDIVFKIVWQNYSFKKELKKNDYIDVTGEWFAAWQTSVDGTQLLNTESIIMKQKGQTAIVRNRERSPENPQGGYLWESQMQFFHGKSFMGWYFPIKSENNTSKGMMYMTFFSQKKMFYGKWVGSGYDGDLLTGFLVFAKTRELAISELEKIITNHSDSINIIGYQF